MKTSRKKKPLTFGELIMAAYTACGKRKAQALVRFAVNAHVVVFRGRQHGVVSQ